VGAGGQATMGASRQIEGDGGQPTMGASRQIEGDGGQDVVGAGGQGTTGASRQIEGDGGQRAGAIQQGRPQLSAVPMPTAAKALLMLVRQRS